MLLGIYLIVISAMGKTTNALEKVAESYFDGYMTKAFELFGYIKNQHLQIAESLGLTDNSWLQQKMLDFFTEVEWLLHDKPVRSFDYYYDQIVCTGELLSTTIISQFLNDAGVPNHWIDVRDIFATDDQFRAANINWGKTRFENSGTNSPVV